MPTKNTAKKSANASVADNHSALRPHRKTVKGGVKKSSAAKPAKDPAPKEEAPQARVREEILSAPEIAGETHAQAEEIRPGMIRDRYFEAVGRRKTAIARARIFTKSGDFRVNDRPYGAYFPTEELQRITEDALKKMKLWERFRVSVKVSGGGSRGQAEAVRHALA